jgi:hypothetical protein
MLGGEYGLSSSSLRNFLKPSVRRSSIFSSPYLQTFHISEGYCICKFCDIVARLSDNRQVLDWWLDLLDTFIAHDYTSQITMTHKLVSTVIAWWQFSMAGISLVLGPCPCVVVTISHHPHTLTDDHGRYSHQLLAPVLSSTGLQLPN